MLTVAVLRRDYPGAFQMLHKIAKTPTSVFDDHKVRTGGARAGAGAAAHGGVGSDSGTTTT